MKIIFRKKKTYVDVIKELRDTFFNNPQQKVMELLKENPTGFIEATINFYEGKPLFWVMKTNDGRIFVTHTHQKGVVEIK